MHQEMQRIVQIDEGSGENTASIDEDATYLRVKAADKKCHRLIYGLGDRSSDTRVAHLTIPLHAHPGMILSYVSSLRTRFNWRCERKWILRLKCYKINLMRLRLY